MIDLAKKRYKNSRVDFVSKSNQIELVATMLKNNLRGYSQMRKYVTEINPKLDKLHSHKEIVDYVSGLDYVNKLYFFSAGLLELTMFELHYLERNKEIKEATRNAELLKEIFDRNSKDLKLNANNYVDICDIKNVVLNVFTDLYTNADVVKNERAKQIIYAYQSNFEKYFKGVLSPMEVFASLVYLKSASVTTEQLKNGVERLNISIKKSGGELSKVRFNYKDIDSDIEKLTEVIPMPEMEQHIAVLKENNELAELTFGKIVTDYTEADKLSLLDIFVVLGYPASDVTEI